MKPSDIGLIIRPLDIEWSKQTHALLRSGARWGVPRSGLFFKRTDSGYELADVMPYTDDMAMWYHLGADVPESAEALLEYQKNDYLTIMLVHAEAGLVVNDPRELLIKNSSCIY